MLVSSKDLDKIECLSGLFWVYYLGLCSIGTLAYRGLWILKNPAS